MGGLIAIAAALYFVPSIVAFGHEHPNRVAISWVNLALGWTILGWIAAIIWAFRGRRTLAAR